MKKATTEQLAAMTEDEFKNTFKQGKKQTAQRA